METSEFRKSIFISPLHECYTTLLTVLCTSAKLSVDYYHYIFNLPSYTVSATQSIIHFFNWNYTRSQA